MQCSQLDCCHGLCSRQRGVRPRIERKSWSSCLSVCWPLPPAGMSTSETSRPRSLWDSGYGLSAGSHKDRKHSWWVARLCHSESLGVRAGTNRRYGLALPSHLPQTPRRQRYVHLRAARVRHGAFRGEAVPVPVQPDFLEDLKNEAVASRRILIPLVSRI
jgi:hypothetical protein